MLVKIIKGTYGHRPDPDTARVIRKDNKSPAFELNDAEAKRIISLGVAQSCELVVEASCGDDMEEDSEYQDRIFPQMTAENIESMEFNDLRKVAKIYGIDTKGTKNELISRLKEKICDGIKEEQTKGTNENLDEGRRTDEDSDSDSDDDELPPEFAAQEPE